MTQPRSCKKCGHLNLQATHAELEACPECGAIYSRVEAAIRDGKTIAPPPPPKAIEPIPKPAPVPAPPIVPLATPPEPPPTPAVAATPKLPPPQNNYINELRAKSNYPTFRSFVAFCAGFGYVVGVILFVAGMLSGTTVGMAVGAGGGILIILISKFCNEMALMLADLSDAATVIAENSKSKLL